MYGQISPFAIAAIQAGNDALGGKVNQGLVNAYLQPARSALTSGYDQGRQNLLESLGAQGVYGSGIGAGAQGAFEQSQARDIGNLTQSANSQALQTALGMGFQGASLLAGQQQIFNPAAYGNLANQYAQSAIQDPRQYARANPLGGILGGLASAGLGSLNFGAIPGNVFK